MSTIKNVAGDDLSIDIAALKPCVNISCGLDTPCWFLFSMTADQAEEMAAILVTKANEIRAEVAA